MKLSIFSNVEVVAVKKEDGKSEQKIKVKYEDLEFVFLYYAKEELQVGKYNFMLVDSFNLANKVNGKIQTITNDSTVYTINSGKAFKLSELKEDKNGNGFASYTLSAGSKFKNEEGKYGYVYTNLKHFRLSGNLYNRLKDTIVTVLSKTKFNKKEDKVYVDDNVVESSLIFIDDENKKKSKSKTLAVPDNDF